MVQPQLLGGDDGEMLINAVIVNWPVFDILTSRRQWKQVK